jgi:hypothetical protein
MPLGYVISTTIIKWFVFIITFIKRKKFCQVSVIMKKIAAHRNREKYEWGTQCVSGWQRVKTGCSYHAKYGAVVRTVLI